jgi:hypothetical protein
MRRKKRRLVVFCFVVLVAIAFSCGAGQALDINGSGSWSPSVDSSDLTGGAGTDLLGAYESPADQVLLTLSGASGPSDNWRVDVKRTDISWHGDLVLWVSRTGDGTGSGAISGGTGYQQVGASDTAFFAGSGDRVGVPVQVKLSGVSVGIAAGTYSTNLVFTVVDTP